MNDAEQLHGFEARLLSALTDVVRENNTDNSTPVAATSRASAHGRNPVRMGAVAAAVVAVIAVATVLPGGTTRAYAVRQHPGGVLEVTWDDELDPEALEATLRKHDIDVTVVTEVVSPSLVGKVTGMGPVRDQLQGAFRWGEQTSSFTIDPALFEGPFHILVSVAAKEGQDYAGAAEVFEQGEVLGGLQCAVDGPLRSEHVAEQLETMGLTAEWQVVGQENFKDGVPAGEVVWGHARNARTVSLGVHLDGDTATYGKSALLQGKSCTPEHAAPWR